MEVIPVICKERGLPCIVFEGKVWRDLVITAVNYLSNEKLHFQTKNCEHGTFKLFLIN